MIRYNEFFPLKKKYIFININTIPGFVCIFMTLMFWIFFCLLRLWFVLYYTNVQWCILAVSNSRADHSPNWDVFIFFILLQPLWKSCLTQLVRCKLKVHFQSALWQLYILAWIWEPKLRTRDFFNDIFQWLVIWKFK